MAKRKDSKTKTKTVKKTALKSKKASKAKDVPAVADKKNKDEAEDKEKSKTEQRIEDNLILISQEANKKARWYVVHVYSGHEKKVAEALRQRTETLHLLDKILRVFIPTQDKIQIRRGQRRTVSEKIFPGYILVEMEMTDNAWLAIRTTEGVTGFVGMSSRPTPLPKSEVEAIMKYAEQSDTQYKADFVDGEAVRITDGPFNDFLGTVDNIDEERGKVSVLINIFGRETPVELDFLQVKKV
ncbi:MAG: transcription termination/antitermination factor NusG [Candidatus Pacebacteria bacterium]|jgi:transcriptional antiterminator NusG|nr:transcription termination/antitermination factor NusG [Candidatus Paceibacterota bacterium]